MALQDIQHILGDPNFRSLEDPEMIKVLSREDPDFLGLPEIEKPKALAKVKSMWERLPRELTSLPGQPAGALLTGQYRPAGVSSPYSSLSPEDRQRQTELDVFAQKNPGRAMTADLGRFILETGGGLVAALPTAPTGPGAIVAGGLGFAGGKELSDILDMSLETPRGRALSRRTPLEGVAEVGTDIASGTALEGLIRGGGAVGRRVIQELANIPGRFLRTASDPSSQAIANQLADRGVTLTPGMATGAPFMKGAEFGLELSPLSGARIGKEFEVIENQFAKAQEGALEKMGPAQGDIQFGEKLKLMISKGDELSREGVNLAYEEAAKAVPEELIFKATESSKAARSLLEKERGLPPALREQVDLLKQITGTGSLEKIIPPSFNWPSLVRVRARINNLIESANSRAGSAEEVKILNDLNAGVRKDLEKFASSGGSLDALKAADALHVARQEVFSNPKIVSLLNATPEAFKGLVARGESSELMSKLKKIVGEEGFAPIKRTFAEKIFATNKPFEEFGDDTLKSVFSPSEITDLKSFYKQAKFIDLQRPSESTRTATTITRNLVGIGALGVSLVNPLTAAGTTLGASQMAKLWVSPAGRKYLIEGTKIPADSTAGRRIHNSIRALVAGGAAANSAAEGPSLDDLILQSRDRYSP